MVVRVVTPVRRHSGWGGAALPGLAVIAIGATATWWITADRPEVAPRDAISVVAGRGDAAVSAPVRIVPLPSPIASPAADRPARRARHVAAVAALAHAARDGQMMGALTVEQPPDRRGAAIEETVLSIFRARAPIADASKVAVSCTITLCEVSGVSARLDPAATRAALRDDGLLKAMAGLGYSTGPDEESPAPDGGTAFVFYFNRVM